MSAWPAIWRGVLGEELPRSYLAFDTETTGFSKDYDVIVEIGHVLVEDGEVVDRLNLVIDWSDDRHVPTDWLANKLYEVRQHMAAHGKSYKMTMERMRKEGLKPEKVFPFYRDLFSTLKEKGAFFVGHNAYRFDEAMLLHNMVGFGYAKDFDFGDFALLDTEVFEKLLLHREDLKTRLRPDDTLRSWSTRVARANFGRVQTNLDRHCFEKYNLAGLAGVDSGLLHTAG